MKVPFLELAPQYKAIKREMNAALQETFRRSDFILGQEEALFEKEFARFCGRKFAVGVNSGTDALFLSLVSLAIGEGDEVIVPTFTFIATALAVTYTGAKPVFVDVDEKTCNIDAGKIERAITKRTKAVIPVHLFGQSADMGPIMRLSRSHGIKVIEDAAQAHGAKYKFRGNRWEACGAMGDTGCFSFYPTKNLGAFGDAGMIVLDDRKTYEKLLTLRDCGRKSRYEHDIIGYNSRLDTVQAAVLRTKLRYLGRWNALRRLAAEEYAGMLRLSPAITLPVEERYARHVYHVYSVRVNNRDEAVEYLHKKGIGALIHYPIPLHLQKAYAGLRYKKGDFPVSEKIARQIISLPMHPFLTKAKIQYVSRHLLKACKF